MARKKTVKRQAGALLALPLIIGGATIPAVMTAANAETSATSTTAGVSNTTVNLTAQDFTVTGDTLTWQEFVNWNLNTNKVPAQGQDGVTTYKVNVQDLIGTKIKPDTLKIGFGVSGLRGMNNNIPVFSKEPTKSLTYSGMTFTADENGVITMPIPNKYLGWVSLPFTVEAEDGSTITQQINWGSPLPSLEGSCNESNAATTIGKLGTTQENPVTVKPGAEGEVTFTYTNNTPYLATTANQPTYPSLDGGGEAHIAAMKANGDTNIYLQFFKDGKKVELPEVTVAPGETKTITVSTLKASDTAGEVTGATYTLKELLPRFTAFIKTIPTDHLAAQPILAKNVPDLAYDYSKMHPSTAGIDAMGGLDARRAPRLASGVDTSKLVDSSKWTAEDYILTRGNIDPTFAAYSPTTANTVDGDTLYIRDGNKEHSCDYSVYVKPEAVPTAEPTPDVTPTPAPSVTPEPTPTPTPSTVPPVPVVTPTPTEVPTPAPKTEEPTPEPSVTPSETPKTVEPPATTEPTPVLSSPSSIPSVEPTPDATTPAPSVSPSEPAVVKPSEPVVKPSEPGKPVEAKTGHESGSTVNVGLLAGIGAAAVVGIAAIALGFMKRKSE